MPRPARSIVPGQPLHLTQRGTDQTAIFVEPADYAYFLELLCQGGSKEGCAIHAYVLMTNHVHLLVTPSHAKSTARLMQTIGRCYVRYFNHRYARTGALWEGRYRSKAVDSGHHLLASSRYIESNPVRAGIVGAPAEYPWSSFAHNALGAIGGIVTAHAVFDGLAVDPAERRRRYLALFDAHLGLPAGLVATRDARAASADPVGRFRDEVEALLRRKAWKWSGSDRPPDAAPGANDRHGIG